LVLAVWVVVVGGEVEMDELDIAVVCQGSFADNAVRLAADYRQVVLGFEEVPNGCSSGAAQALHEDLPAEATGIVVGVAAGIGLRRAVVAGVDIVVAHVLLLEPE
jgi:hypothetical protein